MGILQGALHRCAKPFLTKCRVPCTPASRSVQAWQHQPRRLPRHNHLGAIKSSLHLLHPLPAAAAQPLVVEQAGHKGHGRSRALCLVRDQVLIRGVQKLWFPVIWEGIIES